MPLPIVPPALLNGHGLFAQNSEPHAQPGNHLRITNHPLLGLPVAPYIIWRGITGDQELALRNETIFTDSIGRVLSPPFKLDSNIPVTVTLIFNNNESSVWARVNTDLDSGGEPVTLLAEAYVASLYGPTLLARRDSAPFAFSGPGIVQLVLRGEAMILGVEWMERSIDPKINLQPWAALNLPIEGGVRYANIENPILHATARLAMQAPKKLPLHETLGMLAPASAPPPPLGFEAARVASLTQPLGEDLDNLINNTSTSPFEQVIVDKLKDENETEIGEVQTHRLQRVLQTQLDPGAASFAGFKTYDDGSAGRDTGFVFYWIDAYFADPGILSAVAEHIGNAAEAPLLRTLIDNLHKRNFIGSSDELKDQLRKPIAAIDNVSLDEKNLPLLEERNDYLGFGTLVVIDVSAPPLPVEPPRIEAHRQIGWQPDAPFVARREVRLDITDSSAGHLLAAEKRTLDSKEVVESLNSINEAGFHLPLALGVNNDDETQAPLGEPISGFLTDRNGAPVDIRYGVAQQDRFGRWSNWHSATNTPEDRPSPPRPILEVYYTQPPLPGSARDPIAAGSVRIRTPIPPPESLAPASFALLQLELDIEDLSTGRIERQLVPLPDPIPTDEKLDTVFPAPVLAPTERRQLRLLARWHDDSGRPAELSTSALSEPSTVTLQDPRAPDETITAVGDLRYCARPDVTGLAVIEHDWQAASASTRYAVYYTDENRLRSYLQELSERGAASANESSALTDITNATDAPALAGALRRNSHVFPAYLFERLDNAVIELPGNQRRFQHTVSGSLRVLNIYRISAESAINARQDIAVLPLIIYAVPNADPPPVPLLQITSLDPSDNTGTYSIEATVSLISAGSTPAARLRLRRSNLGATDTQRMPIVNVQSLTSASGFATTLPMPAAIEGMQSAMAIDTGALAIKTSAIIQPWVNYHWIAEVQGEDAPGSSGQRIQGLWSAPSAPVSLMLIPPHPPAAVEQLTASGVDPGTALLTGIVLRFKHNESLSGGMQGSYRAQIHRRLPDGDFIALKTLDISGTGTFEIDASPDDEPNESVPINTVYRLSVIDPLGRTSEPADTVLNNDKP